MSIKKSNRVLKNKNKRTLWNNKNTEASNKKWVWRITDKEMKSEKKRESNDIEAIILRRNRVIVYKNSYRFVGRRILNISAKECIYVEITCEH